MGKKKSYDQKFSHKWLEDPLLRGWIQPSEEPGQTAACIYCCCSLIGSKTLMLRHAQNRKHLKNVDAGPRSGLVKAKNKQNKKKQKQKSKETDMKENQAKDLNDADNETIRISFLSEDQVETSVNLRPIHIKSEFVPNYKEAVGEDVEEQIAEEEEAEEGQKLMEDEQMVERREIVNEEEMVVEHIDQDNTNGDNIEHSEPNERVAEITPKSIVASMSTLVKHKYIEEWKKNTKLGEWICVNKVPGYSAFCTFCKCHLNGNKNSMFKHALSPKHKANAKLISQEKKTYYDQKFNSDWLNDPILRSWITPSEVKTAFCKKCQRHLQGSKTQMYRHAQNPRHTKNILEGPSDDRVKSELRMSAFIAEHNLSLDLTHHLPQLIKALVPDSDIIKSISCNPAKTEFFIKNVLAIDRLNDVSNKLLSTVFSIIVDESTDIYSNKSLALVVRYFDEDSKNVEDSFLTIIDVLDIEGLFQTIVEFFASINVPLTNLLGFAADSCNALVGKYSNLQLKLMNVNPFIYVSGCVQNSLEICVSMAVSKFPDTYEKLCHDMYDYMFYKPQQVGDFQLVYPLFSEEMMELVKLSNTRWLSKSEVVTKIVDNWDTLVSYFSLCAANEEDIKSQQILIVLTNPMCKLVFLFLNFFLPTIHDLSLEFQSSKYFLNSLLSAIGDKIKMILKFYLKSRYVNEVALSELNPMLENQFLDFENMYFGARVDSYIPTLDPSCFEMILHFKGHALNFYMEFCTQLLERVDFKDSVLKYLYILNPEICKSDLYLSIKPLAMLFPNVIQSELLDELETEWWNIRSCNSLMSADDFFVFWNKVLEERNEDSSAKYPLMAKFIKAMLCLPHCTEATMNVFTKIRRNNIKTRNRHDSAMMSSLLLIQEKLRGSSSDHFEISDALLCLAKSYTERNSRNNILFKS